MRSQHVPGRRSQPKITLGICHNNRAANSRITLEAGRIQHRLARRGHGRLGIHDKIAISNRAPVSADGHPPRLSRSAPLLTELFEPCLREVLGPHAGVKRDSCLELQKKRLRDRGYLGGIG